jgi:hypothetical protein
VEYKQQLSHKKLLLQTRCGAAMSVISGGYCNYSMKRFMPMLKSSGYFVWRIIILHVSYIGSCLVAINDDASCLYHN